MLSALPMVASAALVQATWVSGIAGDPTDAGAFRISDPHVSWVGGGLVDDAVVPQGYVGLLFQDAGWSLRPTLDANVRGAGGPAARACAPAGAGAR